MLLANPISFNHPVYISVGGRERGGGVGRGRGKEREVGREKERVCVIGKPISFGRVILHGFLLALFLWRT